jgi:nicotinamide-nucleotide amidase
MTVYETRHGARGVALTTNVTLTCIDQGLVHRAADIVQTLRRAHLTAVTAESCTAGLICSVLSQADGAGEVLHGGFVTYSKANKTMALGVDRSLLKRDGSVAPDVVRQMVQGALLRSPADVALAVSGVLGPSPDEDGNPVGLVYFGIGRRDGAITISRKNYGDQPHDTLRRSVVMDGLDLFGHSSVGR